MVSAHRLSGVRKLGSVGQPIPGVQVSIQDDADGLLPVGETGEVCVRGPNVMTGYYRSPDETARAIRNGWLQTGDMGRLDADGFVYIVERKKDLIIRGGLTIYPSEVEEVLYASPQVAEAAVVGNASSRHGRGGARVRRPEGWPGRPEEEVIAFCRSRLAHFKCPKEVRFVGALPKNPIGKILRKELRAWT